MATELARTLAGAAVALCAWALPCMGLAQTADWPSKPLRLVVAFPPGGNSDVVARLISNELGKALGQNVIVENVPGASGVIGANGVARAAPDGYTLLLGTVGTQAINPSLFNSLSEKNLDSFAPVTMFTTIPNVLVVHRDLPVNSVAELAAYARKQSRPLTFASPGVGSSIHLSGEMFKLASGLPMMHVPYRGSAPALNDLIGRQVDLMFDNLPPSLPHIQSGKLKALAVTSARRNPLLPKVPTMIESGYPDFEIGSWNGIMAPAGTPPDVIGKLDAAMRKVAGSPDFKQRIEQLGGEARADGPEVFGPFIRAEYRRWADVIQAAGIEKQ